MFYFQMFTLGTQYHGPLGTEPVLIESLELMKLNRGQLRLERVRHHLKENSMNILKLITCLIAIISGAYFAGAADLTLTNKEPDLPAVVMGHMISPDVREEANKLVTSELRIAYLSSVIASNAVDTNEIENFRKSSAIRLVSVIKSTNSIPILISNITFVDVRFPERP